MSSLLFLFCSFNWNGVWGLNSDIIINDSSISAASLASFSESVASIVQSISLGWTNTAVYPQLVVGFLLAADKFPSRYEFERFIASDQFFDPNDILKWITWNQCVLNADRDDFVNLVRHDIPSFEIFLFGSDGSQIPMLPNSSTQYDPITYCSPPADSLIGFDVFNDAVEGPSIRQVAETGRPISAAPFLLRGLPPDVEFKMGMTMYIPLYGRQPLHGGVVRNITTTRSPYYAGCVATVIHFRPLLHSILSAMPLDSVDVFLFESPVANATSIRYIAHFESPPAATAPNLSAATAEALQPADVGGDLISAFAPAADVRIVDRYFRVLVRARAGSRARNPEPARCAGAEGREGRLGEGSGSRADGARHQPLGARLASLSARVSRARIPHIGTDVRDGLIDRPSVDGQGRGGGRAPPHRARAARGMGRRRAAVAAAGAYARTSTAAGVRSTRAAARRRGAAGRCTAGRRLPDFCLLRCRAGPGLVWVRRGSRGAQASLAQRPPPAPPRRPSLGSRGPGCAPPPLPPPPPSLSTLTRVVGALVERAPLALQSNAREGGGRQRCVVCVSVCVSE